MTTDNLPKEAKLWGELYALLCSWKCVRHGLASMPVSDKHGLDDKAEEIIKKYLTTEIP